MFGDYEPMGVSGAAAQESAFSPGPAASSPDAAPLTFGRAPAPSETDIRDALMRSMLRR